MIPSSVHWTSGRTRCLAWRRRGRAWRGLCGAGEVEEVRALGVVELERPRQRLEHALGDAAHVAALQAGVVRDAHAGQDGDLLAAQSGNAATAVGVQSRLLGRDPAAAGGEELADLLFVSTPRSVDPAVGAWGTLPVPLSTGTPTFPEIRALLRAMTTDKKTWFITGAGRGMGVDIAKAALAAGHNVVATGRNPDAVARRSATADDLLVVKLDVTSAAGRRGGGRGGRRPLRRHRRAGQQRRQLLRRLLRGADPRADRAAARRRA